MFKKIVSMTALVAATLSPSLVLAVDDALAPIHITANIPNKQFHVQPRNPDFGKDEYMYYNTVTYDLSSIRQTFDVKNTDGSVHAHIDGDSFLSNGSVRIPLRVFFNDVFLNEVPQEVVDDASSTPGTQVEMFIHASHWPIPRTPGLYTGNFTVIFDAVPRVSL
ncbi:adhesin [Pseudomonas brassicacearum]|uniref:CS1 type fimbrial major subunit n=1 Tax=Pseudomonas brassicacearum TaxID=930166 RepID=UPI000F49357C|nr:CS1 type fimbrial major subunit [Pseudomonas brassicacearum]ROM67004.1 adhesin [Pseudomonas brassicacearum]